MKKLILVATVAAIAVGCAGEDFTEPKASPKTGVAGAGVNFTGLTRTLTKATDSAVCTPDTAGNVLTASYFDAQLTNGVLSIKGSGNLSAPSSSTMTSYCPSSQFCACTELQRLAFTSPQVNNNALKITGTLNMPNANPGFNRVVFQRAFKAALPGLGTSAEDTILYHVLIFRAGANAQAFVTRVVQVDGGSPSFANHALTLTNAFAGGAEQSFTINMTQPTTGVFAIEVTVGGVTQTSTDDPSSDLQTTGATGPASRFSQTPLITLGGLINAVPTTAVNLVLFTNQGTGASTFNPANAPTIANLIISQ